MDIGTVIGIVLTVVGIAISIFFGISHVTKKKNINNIEIKKSLKPKASKDSKINIKIKDSFNNHKNIRGDD